MRYRIFQVLLVLQVLAAIAYIVEFFGEIFGIYALNAPWEIRELIELGSIISLVIGSCAALFLLTRTMKRNQIVEEQLKVASGDFYELLNNKFSEWGLSDTEKEVALMSLKGFSIAEVASLRGKSEGTIKAQNASLYRKAGVSGRAQLMASLMEDLLDNAVAEQAAENDHPVQQAV